MGDLPGGVIFTFCPLCTFSGITYIFSILSGVKLGLQDDDSDLEYELEAFPAVSSEVSTEAAACVKVYQINCMSFE